MLSEAEGFLRALTGGVGVPTTFQNLRRSRGAEERQAGRRSSGAELPLRAADKTGKSEFIEIFGWAKTVALFRKTRFKGVQWTDFASRLVGVAYNLRRMANLLPLPA